VTSSEKELGPSEEGPIERLSYEPELEVELRGELRDARQAMNTADPSERSLAIGKVPIGIGKLRVVENVVDLGAKLYMRRLSDRELLGQLEVPVVDARPMDDIAAGIASGLGIKGLRATCGRRCRRARV